MKNNFKIEVWETETPGKVDAIMNVNCNIEFLTRNIAKTLFEINETVESNAPDAFNCKNGFWLLVCDIVNAQLEKKAGLKE